MGFFQGLATAIEYEAANPPHEPRLKLKYRHGVRHHCGRKGTLAAVPLPWRCSLEGIPLDKRPAWMAKQSTGEKKGA